MRGPSAKPLEILGDQPEAPVLSIRTIPKFELRFGGKEVVIAGRKSRALIGYLALSDSREESRERVVGLLWSESPEEKARASLRQAIHEVRDTFQQAGFGGLKADKLTVALDRRIIRVDVSDALDAAKNGTAHPCLLVGPNPTDKIMVELETTDPAFRTWLMAKRQTIHERLMRELETALRGASNSTPGARDLASTILNLDSTHEEACRFMIRALAADGEIGAALKIYKTLWDLLDEEYDVEPTHQTQDLIAEIKAALPFNARPTAPTGSKSGDKAAVAAPVIPAATPAQSSVPIGRLTPNVQPSEAKLLLSVGAFKLLGGEPKQDYLAQGFRRELIACLVRFREWLVRDWSKGTTAVSSENQKTEYFLDATGYETNDGIHFVLTLRDGTTDAYLWSERLTLRLENWHQAQQSVVRRIAAALNVHVSAERLSHITKRGSFDLKAYDIWLYGQETLLGLNPERWDKAEELFRQVVHEMPHFAPAFSSLAQLNNSFHIVNPGTFRDPQRTKQALAYAREAVRLDPVDSRSQLCLGWSHAMGKQYGQAMIYVPLAHALNDNDRWTLVSSANCFAFCGHHQQALDIVDHLSRDVPFAPNQLEWAYQVAVHFMAGTYARCIAAAESAGDLNPNVPGFKAAALYHIGQQDAAAAELQRFFALVRTRWRSNEPASAEAITRWFLCMFPIARPEDWERLRDGIAGAGAPVGGLAHHQW